MPRRAAHARLNLDPFVEAYEQARQRTGRAHVSDHLPAGNHPDYPRVLAELVRVDIECRWTDGKPRPLGQYFTDFPDLRHDLSLLQEVAFEDYRQRLDHGEQPSAAEYARQYGIDTSNWAAELDAVEPDPNISDPQQLLATRVVDAAPQTPTNSLVSATTPPPVGVIDPESLAKIEDVTDAARLYRKFHTGSNAVLGSLGESLGPAHLPPEAARVFADLQASSPDAAARYARAFSSLPQVGENFAGFHLVDILGRGTFGCVYLARDGELADRTVALKVAADLSGEPQTLARLQHTNIVPVYSYHKVGALQVVCMPYFGSVTLADVIGDLVRQKTIPGTGQHFVSTLNQRVQKHSSRAPSRLPGSAPANEAAHEPARIEAGATHEFLAKLTRYSYVEAVVWLGVRIADGLGHAHDRGIVHRDLKPANILLTDEGQPMLLDFNLAANEHADRPGASVRIGGTLPYMAPEHLAAFRGESQPVDARSDVYSLGLLLFELLAGRPPFPTRTGPLSEILPKMILARQAGPPSLRSFNPAVSPATEAIVLKCLDPVPSQRYPTARALAEDLERQLGHRPLRHAAEPSSRESIRKWRRRHPRFTSTGSVVAVSLAMILGLAGSILGLLDFKRVIQAKNELAAFQKSASEDAVALGIGMAYGEETLTHSIDCSKATLERYGVLHDPDWLSRPAVVRLPDAERMQLRRTVADLLYLTAQATSIDVRLKPEQARDSAAQFCALAIACLPADELPACFSALQARLTGQPATPPAAEVSQREKFLIASDLVMQRKFRDASMVVEQLLEADPSVMPARFLKGHCQMWMGLHQEAVDSYDACAAQNPQFHWAFYMRAVARERLGKPAAAREDYNRAINIRGDIPVFYLNRARQAHEKFNDYNSAVADLTRAMELGGRQARLYLYRARSLKQLGRTREASVDFRVGYKLPPLDELDWILRGEMRMDSHPVDALADFDQALKLNPDSKRAKEKRELLLSRKTVADGRTDLGSE